MVALIATMTFALTSCSSDDEDEDGNNASKFLCGQVTVKDGNGDPETRYAYDGKWHAGHQEVSGSVLDYLKSGATFTVYISSTPPSEISSDGDYFLMTPSLFTSECQIETSTEIREGAELEISGLNWGNGTFDNAGYFDHDFEGSVLVKSIKGDVITLKFTDFIFDYIYKFKVGNSTFRDVVLNGEISFKMEE